MRKLICYHGYEKVAVFSTNDDVGSGQLQNFLKGNDDCSIDILQSVVLPINIVIFEDTIAAMKKSGAKIFVAFMTIDTLAPLLEQGYANGLFGDDTQVFGTSQVSTADLLSVFQPTTDVAAVMKGFIGIQYWPGYALSHTETGRAFMKRWVKQQYTGPDKLGLCNNQRDDAAVNYLYRDAYNKTLCYGLNFSSYSLDGNDLSPFAALTYDATVLMLSGYHDIIVNKKNNAPTAAAVVRSMQNISFEGASGLVSFAQQNGEVYTYDNNMRATGVYYKIVNFQESSYKLSSNLNSRQLASAQVFQQVLYFSSDDGILGCSTAMGCSDIVYRSSSNSPPSDTRPAILVEQSAAVRGLLIALGSLLWLMAIGVIVFLFIYRDSKLIKASQGPLMWFIVLGEMFGGARVINAALEITDASCTAGIWMGHLAFFFVFGCLLLKSWRIDRLVNSKALKRVRITTWDVLKTFFGMLAVIIVYLVVLTFAGVPHQSSIKSTSSNQVTEKYRCTFEHVQYHTALFAAEFIVLIYGMKLCWATKDVPDSVNESKYVAFGRFLYVDIFLYLC
jgi:hypothetical protein